jgi:hypothetical protein
MQLWTGTQNFQSQSHIVTDGQSVSKSWCWAPSEARDQIFITVWQLRSFFFFVGRPLWWEDGCVICTSCRPLPVQCFSGLNALGLAIIFYCLSWSCCWSHIATDGQSVSLGVKPYLGLMTWYILLLFDNYGLAFVGALSDERTGLSFVYAAGHCQRSLSWVWVPWDSRPYFIVSD